MTLQFVFAALTIVAIGHIVWLMVGTRHVHKLATGMIATGAVMYIAPSLGMQPLVAILAGNICVPLLYLLEVKRENCSRVANKKHD
jgi:hypothetical protein